MASSNNTRRSAAATRKPATARDLTQDTLPKNTRAHSRALNRAAADNEAEMERIRMVMAKGADKSYTVARRPYAREELERRETMALIGQVAMLGVFILAVLGWMNQRFNWW